MLLESGANGCQPVIDSASLFGVNYHTYLRQQQPPETFPIYEAAKCVVLCNRRQGAHGVRAVLEGDFMFLTDGKPYRCPPKLSFRLGVVGFARSPQAGLAERNFDKVHYLNFRPDKPQRVQFSRCTELEQ
jgi:hypothetical protein